MKRWQILQGGAVIVGQMSTPEAAETVRARMEQTSPFSFTVREVDISESI